MVHDDDVDKGDDDDEVKMTVVKIQFRKCRKMYENSATERVLWRWKSHTTGFCPRTK